MPTFTIQTDGGARGNPGPAGIGVVILDEAGAKAAELSEFIGIATNNVAEYTAIVRALERVSELADPKTTTLSVKLDSQLVERQLNGVYRVKDATLKTYFEKAKAQIARFATVTFTYIPREQNKRADALANEAMDKAA